MSQTSQETPTKIKIKRGGPNALDYVPLEPGEFVLAGNERLYIGTGDDKRVFIGGKTNRKLRLGGNVTGEIGLDGDKDITMNTKIVGGTCTEPLIAAKLSAGETDRKTFMVRNIAYYYEDELPEDMSTIVANPWDTIIVLSRD